MPLDASQPQYSEYLKPWHAPYPHTHSRPLIDYCTNVWQRDTTKYTVSRSALPPSRMQSRTCRRWLPSMWLFWIVICLILGLYTWSQATVRQHTEHGSVVASGLNEPGTGSDTVSEDKFGHNKNAFLEGITQLGQVDTTLLPGGATDSQDDKGRRLIFIGDIHGCLEELLHLLDKVKYNQATDHIITTGDMVRKGPSSGAVLDFLQSQHASCVRGNHDDRILLQAAQVASSHHEPGSSDPETALARSLTSSQLAYLSSCPVILRVGKVLPYSDLLVVHAGLVPSLDLQNQDSWAVMNMRVISKSTHVPSKDHDRHGYIPWSELWNQYQIQGNGRSDAIDETAKKMLDAHAGTTVVYGHDAKRGLQLRQFTKGLDSGCVKGGKLTAMVLGKHLEEIVSVRCKQYV